jgi:hypothetical protein
MVKHKGKDKVHPITGHEVTKVEQRYSCTPPSNSAVYGVSGQRRAQAAVPPETNRYPLHRRLGGPHCNLIQNNYKNCQCKGKGTFSISKP